MRATIEAVIHELETWQAHPADAHRTSAVVDVCVTMLRQAIVGKPTPSKPAYPGIALRRAPAVGADLDLVPAGHPIAGDREVETGYILQDAGNRTVYATATHPAVLLRDARTLEAEVQCLFDLAALEDR